MSTYLRKRFDKAHADRRQALLHAFRSSYEQPPSAVEGEEPDAWGPLAGAWIQFRTVPEAVATLKGIGPPG